MKTTFGVTTVKPSNTKLTNGYTLFDWVMRQKCFPAFWGRPISGENAITSDELAFLKEKNCKTMLVFDDFTEAEISSNDGQKLAIRAIDAAIKLGIPQNKGYAIFVVVPSDWSINHNWMISFAKYLDFHGFIPAFVGNTDSSKNFNFDRQSSHYINFMAEEPFVTIFAATEPKLNDMPSEWTPFCPSAIKPDDINLWVTNSFNFDEIEISEVYVNDQNLIDSML